MVFCRRGPSIGHVHRYSYCAHAMVMALCPSPFGRQEVGAGRPSHSFLLAPFPPGLLDVCSRMSDQDASSSPAAALVEVEPLSPAPTLGSSASTLDAESPRAILSPLAKKIPMAKRGKDEDEFRQRDVQRRCLIRCVDWLVKNEVAASMMWNHIMTGQLNLQGARPESEWFKEPPKCMSKVDLKWRAQFLQDFSDGSLTSDLIARIDERDENALHELWCLLTKMTGSEALPEESQEKALMAVAVKLRMEQVRAGTVQRWVDRAVDKRTGVINWLAGGAFTFVFENNRLVHAKHYTGAEVVVPDFITIKKDFNIESPAVDTLTKFTKHPLEVQVKTLFPKDIGANTLLFDKKGRGMKTLLHEAQDKLRDRRARLRGGTSEGSTLVLKDHAKECRTAALAKARAKVESRPQKRARTIQLDVQGAA